MDLGLTARRVVVTGASRGIGRAIARSFAREGAVLHLVARNGSGLDEVADELRRDHRATVTTQALDLAQPGSAQALHEQASTADVLVNNAGAIPRGDVLDVDEDAWRNGWELKVLGYVNTTRAFYRTMCERRQGVIVNVIGLAAEKLEYGYVAGSTGNAALVAFTRTVGSMSLDAGVRVLGVSPGWVETERSLRSLRTRAARELGDAERWRELIAGWPAGRLLVPQEIADVVVFAASARAAGLSGQVITVDAGFGARSYPPARPPVSPTPP